MQHFFNIAAEKLLNAHGISEADLNAAFARLAQHELDDADLYFQLNRAEAWALEEGMVKSGSHHIHQGVGVRAVVGDKTALAFSGDLSAASLLAAADTTRAIAAAGQSQRVGLPTSKTIRQQSLYAAEDPIPSMSSAEKVALLMRIESLAKARDPRVKQVMASLAAEHDTILIARLDGLRAADIRPLVRVSVSVIVEQNDRREQGSSGGGGRFDFAYFDEARLQEYVNRAVDQALLNLEAREAPAGEMPVVLGSGWPGVLLHEAIGHGLEGDFNRKGSSAFAGKIGERVAAKGVTIVDDGTIEKRRGSLNIDDEGERTQCTVLIEDGILQNYLQDRLNARLMNVAPTGNGRRESYAHMPLPRMTNTYMRAGDADPQEMIAAVKNGIYAVNFGGGQVDITSGKFVFSASEAWRIENGKLSYPVKGATLIGNGPDVLHHVRMIGRDFALDSGVGVCGKDGQAVPVGVGQPSLLIEGGLTVGGTSAG